MKLLKVSSIVLLVMLFGAAGWYRYRWYNYYHKPLFYNEYSPNRDGVGPWRWNLYPGLNFDDSGKAILMDRDANMVALVDLGRKGYGVEFGRGNENIFRIYIDNKMIEIPRRSNSYVTVDASGCKWRRGLSPGEAERIYRSPALVSQKNPITFSTVQ